MRTAVFGSVEEAEAALALAGSAGFRFRCGVCGRVHRYPGGGCRRCLSKIRNRWKDIWVMAPRVDYGESNPDYRRPALAAPWWFLAWRGPRPVVLTPTEADFRIVLVMGLSGRSARTVLWERINRRAELIQRKWLPAVEQARATWLAGKEWLERILSDLRVLEDACFQVEKDERGEIAVAELKMLPARLPPPPQDVYRTAASGPVWASQLAVAAGLARGNWRLLSFEYRNGWLRAELRRTGRKTSCWVRARFPGPVEVEG